MSDVAWSDALKTLGAVLGACVFVFLIVLGTFAMVAYVAPLFGLDPNACTVVVAP